MQRVHFECVENGTHNYDKTRETDGMEEKEEEEEEVAEE